MTDASGATAIAPFRTLHYQRHNQRRQEHLASLGLPLHGRSVLEVGAGVGDHTSFFIDRGCKVTSIEARPELCEEYARWLPNGYDDHSRLPTVINGRAELTDILVSRPVDVVYCYGLLYHLADPAMALAAMARRCLGLLLLETCVSVGDTDELVMCQEHDETTQSVVGIGCRPMRPWVFNQLGMLFDHVYMPATQPNHEEFPIDWTPEGAPFPARTRAVFVASRHALALPTLLDHVPAKQTRAP